MKKRSIGILLLGLTVCTCISGCSSQSIADVNEKSIQAEEETETEYAKKDVVIKEPEEKTHLSLREQAAPLSKGNRLLSRNETATYRGIEVSVVDVLLADSKEEAGLTEEELAYFSGQNGGEDIDTVKKNEDWEYIWPFVRIRLKNTMNEEQDICAGQLELYNVYDDGEYKKVTKVSEGYSKVYNADYKGTSFENFVSLQPGEERIVTVAYLGMEPSEKKGLFIITNFNKLNIAFHVDEVIGIHRVSWEDIIKPDSTINTEDKSAATGVIKLEGKLVVILDFEKIVTDISPETGLKVSDVEERTARDRSDSPILIAEDSPLLGKMISECLKKSGYTNLIMTMNGQEAWDKLTEFKKKGTVRQDVHCIITDIEMPLMDGHRLTKLCKSDDEIKKIPLIIFSSLVNEEMRKKGEQLGADAQLTKPEIGMLVEAIDNLIDKSVD